MQGWRFLDTPLAVGLRVLGDLLVLNLLFLIGSIPIVTMGASFSALYAVLLRQLREGGSCPVIQTFLHSFLQNFRKATGLFFGMLLCLLLAWGDFLYCQNLNGIMQLVYGVLAAALLLAGLSIFTLGFSQQSCYENSLKNYLKNCGMLLLAAPWQTLCSIAAWLAPWGLLVLLPTEFLVKFGAAYLMWGFSFPAWCTARLLHPVFQKITK